MSLKGVWVKNNYIQKGNSWCAVDGGEKEPEPREDPTRRQVWRLRQQRDTVLECGYGGANGSEGLTLRELPYWKASKLQHTWDLLNYGQGVNSARMSGEIHSDSSHFISIPAWGVSSYFQLCFETATENGWQQFKSCPRKGQAVCKRKVAVKRVRVVHLAFYKVNFSLINNAVIYFDDETDMYLRS